MITPGHSIQIFENLVDESKELSKEQDNYKGGYIAPNFEDELDARIEHELGIIMVNAE